MAEPEGPWITYPGNGNGDAVFIRRCKNCNRFVKADEQVFVNEETGLRPGQNSEPSDFLSKTEEK